MTRVRWAFFPDFGDDSDEQDGDDVEVGVDCDAGGDFAHSWCQ